MVCYFFVTSEFSNLLDFYLEAIIVPSQDISECLEGAQQGKVGWLEISNMMGGGHGHLMPLTTGPFFFNRVCYIMLCNGMLPHHV